MSLDVWLNRVQETVVYERTGLTHNLVEMATRAGVYYCIWRPEELGIQTAGELVPRLQDGLTILKAKPDHFKQFNPENQWGSYDGLIQFIEEYLEACIEYPDAIVEVCR